MAPDVLVLFQSMLVDDYSYIFVPAIVEYPFSSEDIKGKFLHHYSTAFAVEAVWYHLEALKRGSWPCAFQEFNTKFLDLAHLAGRNRLNTIGEIGFI